MSSKRRPGSIETDRVKELYNIVLQDFLNKNNIKIFWRITSLGAVCHNGLIVLLEIYLEELFLNKVMPIGLMYYPQKQKNVIIEHKLLLS